MKTRLIVIMILAAVGIVFAIGLGIMLLWNWLIPAIFSGPSINLWQALGLWLLVQLLTAGAASASERD